VSCILKASWKADVGKLTWRWPHWARIIVRNKALPQAPRPRITSDLCNPSISMASVGCIGVHAVPHTGS
jgi:hypothetical protein